MAEERERPGGPRIDAGVFFLTQSQWDRLYRGYADPGGRPLVMDPHEHPMVMEGYSLLWCWDVGLWVSVDHEAHSAVIEKRAERKREIADVKNRDRRARPSVGWGVEVVVPKVPSRGYASSYREQKIAAHATRGGQGTVARAFKRWP